MSDSEQSEAEIGVQCPHCLSDKYPWFSRSLPMGYFCTDCGKSVDELPSVLELVTLTTPPGQKGADQLMRDIMQEATNGMGIPKKVAEVDYEADFKHLSRRIKDLRFEMTCQMLEEDAVEKLKKRIGKPNPIKLAWCRFWCWLTRKDHE